MLQQFSYLLKSHDVAFCSLYKKECWYKSKLIHCFCIRICLKLLLPYIASGIKSHQTCCLLLTAVEKQPYLHGGLFFSLRAEIVYMHEQFLDELRWGCNTVTKSSNGCRPSFGYPLKWSLGRTESPALYIQHMFVPFLSLAFFLKMKHFLCWPWMCHSALQLKICCFSGVCSCFPRHSS